MTLLQEQLLAQLAAAFPDGVAWRNLADGTQLTLEEWHRRSNRLARGLLGRGLGQGDRVGLVIGSDEPLEWLVSYIAVHKAGGVAVPLLPRLGPAELDRILTHAGAAIVLCSRGPDELRSAARTIVSTAGGGDARWADLLSSDDADVEPALSPDDVADIMYTSGTTGEPKGVVVRHGGLSTTDRVPPAWLGLGFLSSSPFATTSGSLLVCGPLRGGISGWFLPRFDPERWLSVVARDRPVVAFLVPAMVELIVHAPGFDGADLSSLAVVNVGSAPIAAATLRRFGAGLPRAEILCGYGMTEYGAVTAVPLGDGGRHLGSVGVPLPGVEVRILGPDGEEVPTGEVGQVAIAGTRPPRRTWVIRRGRHAPGWTVGCAAATWATSTRTATSGSWAGRRRSSSAAATTSCPPRWRPPSSSTLPWRRRLWRPCRIRCSEKTSRPGWSSTGRRRPTSCAGSS